MLRVATKMIESYKSKYKKIGALPIRIVKSNVSSVGPSSERNMRVDECRQTTVCMSCFDSHCVNLVKRR